jgi:hypothetical protein
LGFDPSAFQRRQHGALVHRRGPIDFLRLKRAMVQARLDATFFQAIVCERRPAFASGHDFTGLHVIELLVFSWNRSALSRRVVHGSWAWCSRVSPPRSVHQDLDRAAMLRGDGAGVIHGPSGSLPCLQLRGQCDLELESCHRRGRTVQWLPVATCRLSSLGSGRGHSRRVFNLGEVPEWEAAAARLAGEGRLRYPHIDM